MGATECHQISFKHRQGSKAEEGHNIAVAGNTTRQKPNAPSKSKSKTKTADRFRSSKNSNLKAKGDRFLQERGKSITKLPFANLFWDIPKNILYIMASYYDMYNNVKDEPKYAQEAKGYREGYNDVQKITANRKNIEDMTTKDVKAIREEVYAKLRAEYDKNEHLLDRHGNRTRSYGRLKAYSDYIAEMDAAINQRYIDAKSKDEDLLDFEGEEQDLPEPTVPSRGRKDKATTTTVRARPRNVTTTENLNTD